MAKRRSTVSRKLKVKDGRKLIEVPIKTVKSILAGAGFSGKPLMKATKEVFTAGKRFARAGVLGVADFEKAIVKGAATANDLLMETTKKVAKKLLK